MVLPVHYRHLVAIGGKSAQVAAAIWCSEMSHLITTLAQGIQSP